MKLVKNLELKSIGKVLLSTLQILGNMSMVLGLTFPDNFFEFLVLFVSFFKFDIANMFNMGCLSDGGYVASLLTNVILIGIVIGIVGVTYLWQSRAAERQEFNGDEDTTAALRELFDQFDTDGDVSMLANTTNSAPDHL